eukprot:7145741-Prymnesium_polylepis.1
MAHLLWELGEGARVQGGTRRRVDAAAQVVLVRRHAQVLPREGGEVPCEGGARAATCAAPAEGTCDETRDVYL